MGRFAKAKANSKLAAPTPRKAASSNVVDNAEAAESSGSQKRTLKRRSSEEGVEKIVWDNFRPFTETQRRMVLDAQGQNVYDRVLSAKRGRRGRASP